MVVLVAEPLKALSSQGLSVNQTVSVSGLDNRRAADRGAGFPVAACPLPAGISRVHFPKAVLWVSGVTRPKPGCLGGVALESHGAKKRLYYGFDYGQLWRFSSSVIKGP